MPPSQVHTVETTAGDPPLRSFRDTLRANDPDEWLAAETAYAGSAMMDPTKTLMRLRECRTDAWFVRNKDTGEVRVSSTTCKLRWCPACAAAKKHWISSQVAKWMPEQDYPKLLTLTVQHSDLPVVDQVNNLYQAFRRFRKMKWFSDRCTGGIWFFQLKLSDSDDRWHPHLHCIVTGKYLPLRKLSKEWEKATSGSFVVDCKMVKDVANAANEVARYCARPARLSKLSFTERSEIVDGFHNRRLYGTWGTGRALTLAPKSDYVADDWQMLGSWTSVHLRLDHDPAARMIIRAWSTGVPLLDYQPLVDYSADLPPELQHPPPDYELYQQRTFFSNAKSWVARAS